MPDSTLDSSASPVTSFLSNAGLGFLFLLSIGLVAAVWTVSAPLAVVLGIAALVAYAALAGPAQAETLPAAPVQRSAVAGIAGAAALAAALNMGSGTSAPTPPVAEPSRAIAVAQDPSPAQAPPEIQASQPAAAPVAPEPLAPRTDVEPAAPPVSPATDESGPRRGITEAISGLGGN